jgi:hypothetical protein
VVLAACLIGGASGLLSWLEVRCVPRALLVGERAAGAVVVLAVAVAALLG